MNECSQGKWDLDIFTASIYICALFTEDLLFIKGRYIRWIFIFDGILFFPESKCMPTYLVNDYQVEVH